MTNARILGEREWNKLEVRVAVDTTTITLARLGYCEVHKQANALEGKPLKPIAVIATFPGLWKHLAISARRHEFMPVYMGELGTEEEMGTSLKDFGAWLGHKVPDREKLLRGIAEIRARCEATPVKTCMQPTYAHAFSARHAIV